MGQVTLHDKHFEKYLTEEQIQVAIQRLAIDINEAYQGKKVLFVSVLNGAFMFSADLLKSIDLECEITFIKLASYHGTSSSGIVKQLIGLNEELNDREIVILEDIVDTGNTLVKIMEDFKLFEPKSVAIACLLFKPDAYKKEIPIHFKGIEIPNEFIVGYGLDYDGLGRNLRDIYKLRN